LPARASTITNRSSGTPSYKSIAGQPCAPPALTSPMPRSTAPVSPQDRETAATPPRGVRRACVGRRTAAARGRNEQYPRRYRSPLPTTVLHTPVMMATPADLQDFRRRFSAWPNGVIDRVEDIQALEVVTRDIGVELRMWIAEDPDRRVIRTAVATLAGPTGCGLCGIESLEEAARPAPDVANGLRLTPEDGFRRRIAAMPARTDAQSGRPARFHAAALWTPGGGNRRTARGCRPS